ncbi:YvrJ family protein [Metabacillus sp. GX 13764]|uniref:YvrJ family protein n=1 Tax=Metabacillus kandeliae TaxID=2900151 RepID=UPI001E4FB3BB|nr:YvrJ family protein [Metabacillus kandeliae]MCD7035364.1 YvrJ family protein [Metabacillus kandeliae]
MEIDIAQLINILGNFGFPVAIASYLLIRLERKMESLTSAIQELKEIIKKY